MSAAPEIEQATFATLQRLFELVRAAALHAREHALIEESAEALADAIERAQPPFSLFVFADAVLRDRTPLHFELEAFRRMQQLAGAMRRWSVQELTFEHVPEIEALIEFAYAVLTATHVNRAARKPSVEGIKLAVAWRPSAPNSPAAEAAVEVYAGIQLAHACSEAEALSAAGAPWSWPRAQALCARIERLTLAGASAAARSLELERPPWTPARQAVAVAFYVGAVLARMQVPALTRRALTHAALAVGCHGFVDGLPLHEAARAALPRMLVAAGSGSTARRHPHQLRTAALLAALTAPQAPTSVQPAALVHAAYQVELQRTRALPGVQQSRVDLHAWLASALGGAVHPGWGRALLSVLGLVPAGSHVLADGRLGIVLGPGRDGDPFRPKVLLGGALATPTERVQLHSPLAMTPWAK